MLKKLWLRNGLFKDDNNILRTALTLPLLPVRSIPEGCTYLLSVADKGSKNHEIFANEIRKLMVAIPDHVSVAQSSADRYDTVLGITRKQLEFGLLKSKPLAEIFAHLTKVANNKEKSKDVNSEFTVKSKNVWHKMFATPGKLSTIECVLQLTVESDKFVNFQNQKN